MSHRGFKSLCGFSAALVCGLLLHDPAAAGVSQASPEFVECWDDFGGWIAFRTAGQGVFFDHQMTPPNDDYFENNVPPDLTPSIVSGIPGHINSYDGIPENTSEVRLQTHIGTAAGPLPYTFLTPEFAFVQSGDHDSRPSGLISCEEG